MLSGEVFIFNSLTHDIIFLVDLKTHLSFLLLPIFVAFCLNFTLLPSIQEIFTHHGGRRA